MSALKIKDTLMHVQTKRKTLINPERKPEEKNVNANKLKK